VGSHPRRIKPLGEPGAGSDEWDDDLIVGSCDERLRRSEYERSVLEDRLGVYEALIQTEVGGLDRDRRIVDGATRLIYSWWSGGTEDRTFRRELADLATLIPLPDDNAAEDRSHAPSEP
jgi:hypothetical protein